MDNALIIMGLGILVERLASKLVVERICDFEANARVCTMCNLRRFLMRFSCSRAKFQNPKTPNPDDLAAQIALDFFIDARRQNCGKGGGLSNSRKSEVESPAPAAARARNVNNSIRRFWSFRAYNVKRSLKRFCGLCDR